MLLIMHLCLVFLLIVFMSGVSAHGLLCLAFLPGIKGGYVDVIVNININVAN